MRYRKVLRMRLLKVRAWSGPKIGIEAILGAPFISASKNPTKTEADKSRIQIDRRKCSLGFAGVNSGISWNECFFYINIEKPSVIKKIIYAKVIYRSKAVIIFDVLSVARETVNKKRLV